MATIESLYGVKLDDRSEDAAKELVHAYGGLKVALHLIHPLITSKPLFESGQTLLAASRGKRDTDPEFFEPHNFLVKLRFATLPLMRELWESSWLVSAPLAMCRPVVQVVMELIGADNEEPKEPADASVTHTFARESSTVVVPDENCITQLTEMGFPRLAAERALIRTRNNVNSATELLLSHPFPFPPPPELIDDASGDEAVAASGISEDDDALPSGSNTEPPEPPVLLTDVGTSGDTEPSEGAKGVQGWRATLNEAREPLKSVIASKALLLVDEHPSLIFDLHTAFVRPVDAYQKQAVLSLVEDVRAFAPSAHDSHQQQLANRFRLLALVLKETPSSLSEDIRSDLMDRLLALLASNPAGENGRPVINKWLAAHLLVTEFLLTIGEQLKPITLPKEDEPIPELDLSVTSAFPHARAIVFDFCLRLLKVPDLPSDEFLSVLRLIVLVTRNNQFARQFFQRDGIQLLFTRLKASGISAGYSYVAIILRHAVEDPTTLRTIMQLSLKRYFTQPRTRAIDVNTYVRNCSMIALRDPSLFVEVTKSLCELSEPFVPSYQIRLKPEASFDQSAHQSEGTTQAKMQVDTSQTKSEPASMNESSELLIHFLIIELMKTVRPTTDRRAELLSTDFHQQSTSDQAPNITSESNGDDGAHDRFAYSFLLMQMLTELLFSYESCKSAFLSYSSKKRQTPSKETSPKHRAAALQFFLSDLVAFESLNPDPTPEARNRLTLVNHAMSVVLALCVDPSATSEMKDVSPDLISVRKFVLEAISRAIKDTSSSESVDARYGRLLALSELCYRMLMARFSGPSRKTPQDDVPTHIAKVMLEKNFVSIFTNALAEVDLNYPNVKTLLASLLKPLEYL
jgi:E3 ubiquitin-protein ligase HUWE1